MKEFLTYFLLGVAAIAGLITASVAVREDPAPPAPKPLLHLERVSTTSLANDRQPQFLGGLAVSPERIAAVGTYQVFIEQKHPGDRETIPYATVWLSKDARSWDRVNYYKRTLGGHHEWMQDVTFAGGRFVAVGLQDLPSRELEGRVWLSGDGTHWRRVKDNALTGPGDQLLLGVTYARGQFVAVGAKGRGQSGSWDGSVWTSVDGRDWTLLEVAGLGGTLDQSTSGIVWDEEKYVAVGRDESSDGPESSDAAVWTSQDLMIWEPAQDPTDLTGMGDQRMTDIALSNGRYVAVGSDDAFDRDGGDAAVWYTRDPADWYRFDHDQDALGGSGIQEMGGIDVRGDDLVAAGSDTATDLRGDADAAIWILSWDATSASSN